MDTFSASDYIGGSHNGTAYYYGYEVCKCDKCGQVNASEYCENCPDADSEWCFEAKPKKGKVFTKTYKELGAKDMFNLRDCFIRGMMAYIEFLTSQSKKGKVLRI